MLGLLISPVVASAFGIFLHLGVSACTQLTAFLDLLLPLLFPLSPFCPHNHSFGTPEALGLRRLTKTAALIGQIG
jgi:hypothetical protein